MLFQNQTLTSRVPKACRLAISAHDYLKIIDGKDPNFNCSPILLCRRSAKHAGDAETF